MAKKSQTARSAAVRRTANAPAAARHPQATLTPINPVTESHMRGNGNTKGGAATATMLVAPVTNKPNPAAITTQNANPATKAAVAKATSAATSVKNGKAAVRAAAQQINPRRTQIRAENYGYVLKDLRVIAGVAVFMLVVMIVLHFVLPS